ncbi:acyclic terpene utilization AtuA family protein [Variovorax sp. PBL-E5]|uniref:acyclic terpene utilization AtuA family protein n=1 Tax=Variovorax sp. PBL-E5 TaxID=434014 RepID=UPI0013189FDF|nr:acyclic terpene utilization AtuA family protein [Variovorax sp. PBL-E5]VTU45576.1 putative acyl-CoA transferases/carnitine dehydratase [Variovorax sp. PBL-E5]
MKQITGVAPSGSMGSGYNVESFKRAMAANPDFIGQDAGSTDMGPYYHGDDKPFLPLSAYRRDLEVMLAAARSARIPLLIGSAITNGSNRTLALMAQMVREVAKEKKLAFRLAVIDAEIDKTYLKAKAANGKVEAMGPDSDLSAAMIDAAGPIVAQMGMEPFMHALEGGADVVIAGRACDDAIFAALPVLRGFDAGLALHCGKILECAGLSALPYDLGEPMIGRVREDHFEVEPGNANNRCTTVSVAGHSLYERSDPFLQAGPGGINDLTNASFEQVDPRRVKVAGSRFIQDAQYRVKLEGAERIGYRSIVIVGIRDAVMIRELDGVIAHARERAEQRFGARSDGIHLMFRSYGKDGVMGALEPDKAFVPKEVGLVIDAVAPTQDLATAVAMFTRGVMQHADYPGILTTAGNMAYPFSPFGIPVGPAYRYNIYHLMPVANPLECFPVRFEEIR